MLQLLLPRTLTNFIFMQIKPSRTPCSSNNGYPDYFDDRHKRKMLVDM